MNTKYLINTWYAAGFSEDFGRKPVMRTLLEKDLVFYRTEAGQVVALDNRCPHRFAPLSKGVVIGDSIRCPYHGLQYGSSGVCVHNPIGDGKIPRAAKVTAYPLAEREGIVWIWFGDQTPEESRIRSLPELSDPGFETVQGYIRLKAHYQLLIDNLLDLSHAEFLHPYLATDGFNRRTQYSMEQVGEEVTARNWRPNEPITKLWKDAFGEGAPLAVDHRSIVRWQAPSSIHLEVGATRSGQSAEAGPVSHAAHLVTPERADSAHYFWKFARNFQLRDADFAQALQQAIQGAFQAEDEPMIEAQFECMAGQPFESLKPILLPTDSASIRARRILHQLIQQQLQTPKDEVA